MRLRRDPRRPTVPGERVLAWCEVRDGGQVVGTREALHLLPQGHRIPWEEVQAAEWDDESSVLVVSEVGEWGRPRPEHRLTLEDPGRLLELVRERVTASVLLQRYAALGGRGRGGVRVVARRAPSGAVRWVHEYDEDVDPDDPAVRAAADALLARAREEVGDAG